MDRELRFHLERATELNVARGMGADVARRAALVAFGGVERAKEAVRDGRGTRLLEQTSGDVRFAVGSLRRRPAFAVVAMVASGLPACRPGGLGASRRRRSCDRID